MRYVVTFLLAVSLGVAGCSGKGNPLAPTEPGRSPQSADIQPFVLSEQNDPRLPSPMLEATGATAADWAGLRTNPRTPRGRRGPRDLGDPALFWNAKATALANAARLTPPRFARVYALTHVAILDALVAAEDGRRGSLPENTVAAGAASVVLTFLFPADAVRINADANAQAELQNTYGVGARARAWALGRKVGRLVVELAKTDGSDAEFTGAIPVGDGKWVGTAPVLPGAGSWRRWIVRPGATIQVEPPYACGSRQDLRDVEEVYRVSLARTPEQIAIVHKWADSSPPAIWNGLLAQRIAARRTKAISSARAFAYLDVTMYDALVTCWACKYEFWTARPVMRRAGLTTVIPTPNFPSYVSGHSALSGAAAVVLGEIFPRESRFFEQQAEEAAISSLWAGIHFRHDNEQGLLVGKQVGERAVRRMRGDRPLPLVASR